VEGSCPLEEIEDHVLIHLDLIFQVFRFIFYLFRFGNKLGEEDAMAVATNQEYCLKWNNHRSTILSVMDTLLEEESLVDVTLSADGQFIRAHRVILSACSPYFRVSTILKF